MLRSIVHGIPFLKILQFFIEKNIDGFESTGKFPSLPEVLGDYENSDEEEVKDDETCRETKAEERGVSNE